ncbi:hypothetical protein Trydic_g1208 [Trypoxylus dichotomus]
MFEEVVVIGRDVAIVRHSKIAARLAQVYLIFQNQGILQYLEARTQKLQRNINVARTEIEWNGGTEYLGIILHKYLTLSEHNVQVTHSSHTNLRQLHVD